MQARKKGAKLVNGEGGRLGARTKGGPFSISRRAAGHTPFRDQNVQSSGPKSFKKNPIWTKDSLTKGTSQNFPEKGLVLEDPYGAPSGYRFRNALLTERGFPS